MLTTEQLAALKAAICSRVLDWRRGIWTGTDINWLAIPDEQEWPLMPGWITNQPEANSDDAPDYSTFDTIRAGKRESWGFFLARHAISRNKVT